MIVPFRSKITNVAFLESLNSTDQTDIVKFIETKGVEGIVSHDYKLYFKEFDKNADSSCQRRTLAELSELLQVFTNKRVDTIPIDGGVYDSWVLNQEHSAADIALKAAEDAEKLLQKAIKLGASDIHILTEKRNNTTSVKLRINGDMEESSTMNFAVGDALLRSLWVAYGKVTRNEMGINNGTFYYHCKIDGEPTQHMVRMNEGPDVRGGIYFVARVRDPNEIRPLNTLGYNNQQQNAILEMSAHRSGIVTINGPTNSGKSTTLATILSTFPCNRNILEIGDPIETVQSHVRAFELKDSYPGGKEAHLIDVLKCSVQLDTNVLALTEMRDALTARAAYAMSTQGKIVFTTTHVSTFVDTFRRFQNLEITADEILSPDFIRGIVCQTLLPKLCPHCCINGDEANKHHSGNKISRLRWTLQDEGGSIRFRNPEGCSQCRNTGIISRVLVAEAISVDSNMSLIIKDIVTHNKVASFWEYAQAEKIHNSFSHARERILAGEVDPISVEDEIGRFTQDNLRWLYPNSR